jgi:hypothetical protein
MGIRFWFRKLFARPAARPIRKAPVRCRPRLEALEDRTLLTAYTAATVADLVRDIGLANQAGGTNTITLSAAPSSPYTLTAVDNTTDGATGLPVIAAGDNLTIVGNGDIIGRSTASGTPAFRLLDVAAGATLTLQNLTLTNGLASGSGVSAQGGAIYSQGALTLNGVTVQNNKAQGSIGAHGVSTISGNGGAGGGGGDAFGGGVYVAGGTATLTNDTLSGNSAQGGQGGTGGLGGGDPDVVGGPGGSGGDAFGGGVYVAEGIATLTNDTLSGNSAQGGQGGVGGIKEGSGQGGAGGSGGNGFGGGLCAVQGAITLTNDTLSGNHAQGGFGGNDNDGNGGNGGNASGGGLFILGSSTITLANTLIAQDTLTAGGGGGFGGSLGSAGSASGPDVSGSVTSSDHDLVGDGTGSNLKGGVNADQVGTSASPINPLLGPLQNNGGPTQTMALLVNSPAIDAGDSAASGLPGTDQRGFARIRGAAVDIGAYEVQPLSISTATLPNGSYGNPYSQTITATEAGYQGAFTFIVSAGALPTGLSLASDGTLSGTPTAAGSYFLTVTATDSSGYTASQVYTVTVSQATLTVTPTAGQSKSYGATVPTLSYAVTGFVNNDPASTLTGQLGTTATAASPVGSYAFTLGSLSAGSNYTVVLAAGAPTFAVTPALLTITPTAGQSKVYGAAVPALTYTASGLVNNDPLSTLTGALATTASAASPVGSYAFTLGSLSAGSNYTVVLAANPPTFAVTKATLTITANNLTKIIGEANPTFTVGYSGFALGEGPGVLGGTLTFSTPATTSSPPGTYAITPAGLTSGNYAITFVPGTLTIISYAQATTNLQAQVDAATLAPGIESSLDSQLQAAIADFAAGHPADGARQLGAFINHVSAQRGNQIAAALADAWIASAQRIINAVG